MSSIREIAAHLHTVVRMAQRRGATEPPAKQRLRVENDIIEALRMLDDEDLAEIARVRVAQIQP